MFLENYETARKREAFFQEYSNTESEQEDKKRKQQKRKHPTENFTNLIDLNKKFKQMAEVSPINQSSGTRSPFLGEIIESQNEVIYNYKEKQQPPIDIDEDSILRRPLLDISSNYVRNNITQPSTPTTKDTVSVESSEGRTIIKSSLRNITNFS